MVELVEAAPVDHLVWGGIVAGGGGAQRQLGEITPGRKGFRQGLPNRPSFQVGHFSFSHARSSFEPPAPGFQNSVGRQNQVPMCIAWWPLSSECRKSSQYQGFASP